MHLSLPRRRAGRRIFGLKKKKSRQEAVLSASGSQEGMESHGRTNTGPHSSPSLASRQQWAVRERHQRPYSRTLCQTVEPGKCCTAHLDPSLVRHGPGPCVSPHCPTAGTSVVPQVPLVQCLGAWKKRYPARLVGSCGPSDSATRFSSPGVLPGSTSQQ